MRLAKVVMQVQAMTVQVEVRLVQVVANAML